MYIKNLKPLIFLSMLLVVFSLGVFQLAQANSDYCTLEFGYLSSSKDIMREFALAVEEENEDMMANLVATGQVYKVEDSVDIRLLDTSIDGSKVRVMEGDDAGTTGWAFAEIVDCNSSDEGSSSSSSGDSDCCCVASAAYEGEEGEEVETLRSFRDEFLLNNYMGEKVVDLYYNYSPHAANLIRKNSNLRKITKNGILDPLVFTISNTEIVWKN